MDYKVFYRKYRPNSFESIVGQDYTIKMLKNAIINNKISHAYLFTGPRGTGKTSTAKVFAKTINCEHIENGEACGKCASCLSFANSPDIIEIDAASNNGVDDVRELINNVKIAPSESKYKIYIIDEVHMMTQSAFNALLLTLEEPPSHAIFIMATTNVESVPITILSRCQRFNFKKININDIEEQIKYICKNENIEITDEAVAEIAYLSEGGLRDAESLLDQLSSNGEKITIDKIFENYGSISSVFIKKMLDSILNSDIDSFNNYLSELENSNSDYKVFIKKLIKEILKNSIKFKNGEIKSKFNYNDYKNLIFDLNECLIKSNININPYMLIQTTLLNYMDEKKVDKIEEKEDKILEEPKEELKKKIKIEETDNFDDEMLYFLDELKNIRVNNCFAQADKKYLALYQKYLMQIKNTVNYKDNLSLLMDSNFVAASEKIVIIATNLDSTVNMINKNLENIESIFEKRFNLKLNFIAVTTEEWNNLKKEYIQNIKNGVKYEIIDEDGIQELKPVEDSQLQQIATNLFGSDKIEVIGE